MNRTLFVLAASAVIAGCASSPRGLYRWGSYEEVIYASYAAPGDMPPERQIEQLEKDYQLARAANQRVPPGWHAHLGYLYYEAGKTAQARQELLTEKHDFPESAVLVDRLIANLKKQ